VVLRDRAGREPFLDADQEGQGWPGGVSLDWFNMLYQVLLGQGKRARGFGSFVRFYGPAGFGLGR